MSQTVQHETGYRRCVPQGERTAVQPGLTNAISHHSSVFLCGSDWATRRRAAHLRTRVPPARHRSEHSRSLRASCYPSLSPAIRFRYTPLVPYHRGIHRWVAEEQGVHVLRYLRTSFWPLYSQHLRRRHRGDGSHYVRTSGSHGI